MSEIIVQSTSLKGMDLFVDYMHNRVWCKTVIDLIAEGSLLHDSLINPETGKCDTQENINRIESYIQHMFWQKERDYVFLILEEYHPESTEWLNDLISQVDNVKISK